MARKYAYYERRSHPKNDTFAYTLTQKIIDKLFIINDKLADAADLKAEADQVVSRSK